MLSKCCCCVPLRTGSIILAILGILGGLGVFVGSQGFWFNIVLGVFYIVGYPALLFGAIKYNHKAVLVSLVCTAIIIAIGIAFGIIVIASIETFVPEFANNCASMVDVSSNGNNGQVDISGVCAVVRYTTMGITATIFFASAVINCYFWICNYSFYKELKGGNVNPA